MAETETTVFIPCTTFHVKIKRLSVKTNEYNYFTSPPLVEMIAHSLGVNH